jgi:hypothetical protein
MYVRLQTMPSSQEIELIRNEFVQAMGLAANDFYLSGPLTVVSPSDHQFMPVKDESSRWLDVNLWKPYYAAGYERGNPELFVKCAEWLEERIPSAEIYYGHDVNDENVSRFDNAARTSLLDSYRQRRP